MLLRFGCYPYELDKKLVCIFTLIESIFGKFNQRPVIIRAKSGAHCLQKIHEIGRAVDIEIPRRNRQAIWEELNKKLPVEFIAQNFGGHWHIAYMSTELIT